MAWSGIAVAGKERMWEQLPGMRQEGRQDRLGAEDGVVMSGPA